MPDKKNKQTEHQEAMVMAMASCPAVPNCQCAHAQCDIFAGLLWEVRSSQMFLWG